MERDLKEEAKKLIDNLPSLSSWEQLMYEIYVREAIENGLADSIEGRKDSVEVVRAEFDLLLSYIARGHGPKTPSTV